MEQPRIELQRHFNIDLMQVDFNGGVNAATIKRGDGHAIVMNKSLDDKHQAAAFLHEMLHLYHNDNEYQGNIYQLEQERKQELRDLLQILIEEDL